MTNPPQVLEYSNVNLFLIDFFKFKKKSNHKFSYELWGRFLKISKKSYLRQMVVGQRSISSENSEKFCKYFQFKGRSLRHFQELVGFSISKDQQLANNIQNRILYYKRNLEICASKTFLRDTKIPLLLTLLSFDDLTKTPSYLAKILGVELLKLNEYLLVLQLLGLAEESASNNQWIATSKNFQVPDELNSQVLINFHEQSMKKSIELFKSTKKERRAECLMLPLTPEDYIEMTSWLDRFLDRCTEKYQSDSIAHRKLYRFQAALVPEVDFNSSP